MQDLAIDLGFKYGAPELKRAYQKYLTIAEMIGIAVTAGILGIYYLAEYLARDEEPIAVVRIMKYSELGPPPSIQSSISDRDSRRSSAPTRTRRRRDAGAAAFRRVHSASDTP